MHDPRITTALRQLHDLADDAPSSRWRWSIVGLERIGRIRLPAVARAVLDAAPGGHLRGRSDRTALALRKDGSGAAVTMDGRGRVVVPMWLRRASAEAGVLLVGACVDPAVVVVVPVAVLDRIGDLLIGELP
jgi:hypothetical protein